MTNKRIGKEIVGHVQDRSYAQDRESGGTKERLEKAYGEHVQDRRFKSTGDVFCVVKQATSWQIATPETLIDTTTQISRWLYQICRLALVTHGFWMDKIPMFLECLFQGEHVFVCGVGATGI